MSSLAMYTMAQPGAQDELITRHAPLVKRIAYHLMSRLPSSVQVDDLIQAGMIGLLEASRNYDAAQGASFETYASIRIRGAMLDEVRKNDWAPRSVHRKARAVAQAVREVEHKVGRDARDHEVAEMLGMPLDEYHRLLQDANGHRIFSFEELGAGEDTVGDDFPDHKLNPFEGIQNADFQRCLAEAIENLPERERLVISLYYDEELNLREIGEVLGVSESRVSQLHGQALLRLQARLKPWGAEKSEGQ
ncbi:MAG TPA: RNA polymerase sigma factor FliA [Gammaproteobacteria bacterium]|nr:RNA polymerase sigma factor FliA [Gammaproteobacteria bacterium]